MPNFLLMERARLKAWHVRLNVEKVAIFDIGTRGLRLLVAPRELPKYWEKECFYNSGIETWLGHGIEEEADGEKRLALNSYGLRKLVTFLNGLKQELNALGISKVHAIGTAIFRWIANQGEVLEAIHERTGIEVEVISSPMEAEYTLLSLLEILPRLDNPSKQRLGVASLEGDDVIAVADQGGGSLEVLWVCWRERGAARPNIHSVRCENLGTIALRHRFFHTKADGSFAPNPEDNQAGIRAQSRRIHDFAAETIKAESGLLSVKKEKGRIFLFGVGTALTKSLKGNAWKIHGRRYDVERLEEIVELRCAPFEETRQQVRTLWKAINGIEGTGAAKWDREPNVLEEELAILYGLPAFRVLIERVGVEQLMVNGFPLRYGYYASRCAERLGLPYAPCEPEGDFIFVSYARRNVRAVLPDILRIHTAGYRVFYDDAIQAGADFRAKLGEWLEKAAACVVFLSKEAYASDEVRAEVDTAVNRSLRIIPIAIDDSEPPPGWYRIRSMQRMRRADLTSSGFQSLVRRLLSDRCRRLELKFDE